MAGKSGKSMHEDTFKMEKNVSITDIAKCVNVDPSTVSLALNNSPRIAEKTRSRIQEIARAMGYTPNYFAKGLRGRKTKSIGLIVRSLRDQFYVDLLSSMECWLGDHQYSSLLEVTRENSAAQAVDELLERRVDGLAGSGFSQDIECLHKLADLARNGKPLALYVYTSHLKLFENVNVDLVTCDLHQGCYEMTRHLLELGHRRIAFVGGGPGKKTKGYKKAFEEYGIKPDPMLLVEYAYRYQDVSHICHKLMAPKDPPTAIFAYTDDLAAALIKELIKNGYDVPEDVSVAGINDNWHSQMLRLPLTTIRIPTEEIGETLVKMLVERIEKPSLPQRVRQFKTELIKRDSTVSLRARKDLSYVSIK